MSLKLLILPGIGNSDSVHWQSLWQNSNADFSRIEQDDWDYPECSKWVKRLEESLSDYGENTILVAHSLSCLLISHWAANTQLKIRGALLVAPPDPAAPIFPSEALSFANTPLKQLNFQSVLVASADDPYASISYSKNCAVSWGSEFFNIGNAGHINSSSGYGAWPQGELFLRSLIEKTSG